MQFQSCAPRRDKTKNEAGSQQLYGLYRSTQFHVIMSSQFIGAAWNASVELVFILKLSQLFSALETLIGNESCHITRSVEGATEWPAAVPPGGVETGVNLISNPK